MMQATLRGIVLDRYGSMSTFAQKVGWGRKKASDIVNGRRHPTADDMMVIASELKIANDQDFMALFFKGYDLGPDN